MTVKMKNDKGTKVYTIRMYLDLATKIEQLAEVDGRSVNSEVVELLKKGIDLVAAEKRHLANLDPLRIVNADDGNAANGGDGEKHPDAPASASPHDEQDQKGERRELA